MTKDQILQALRCGGELTYRDRLKLVMLLSGPAMIAQLCHIAMEFIDASMVAHIGANAIASIGLVASTLWLVSGLCNSAAVGFYVLASHHIGRRDFNGAHSILRVALPILLTWSMLLAVIGYIIAPYLPHWLGGNECICDDATSYFMIFAGIAPLMQLNFLASGMLRSAGNLKVPSYINIGMCLLDVVFNYIFIYKLGLGVMGAALGSALALFLGVSYMVWCMWHQHELRPDDKHCTQTSYILRARGVWNATRISAPVGLKRIAVSGAQVASTIIVAPLGTVAIAANSLGITIEALCYMPGYALGEAATSLCGQSHGARRPEFVHSFSRITLWLAMIIMSIMGVVMYVGAPSILALMGPEASVAALCTQVLRIEAFAEPMYGASIIGYYVFVGLGDSFKPSLMNLFSIWIVRITLAWALASTYGLPGVWFAMAVELTFRGLILLLRMIMKIKKPQIYNP